MEPQREILHFHACHGIQHERRAYCDHLLHVHGEVSRRVSNIPVRLEERELAIVWASVCRQQVSGPVRAARRRAELGLPKVSKREAERRLKDNRMAGALGGLSLLGTGAPIASVVTRGINHQLRRLFLSPYVVLLPPIIVNI